ncbi:L,D-transpeptidase family protein [Ignatzschineria rhizosphaerae]|uniref:L,D-transpeptidase family protein n=1 Tax=Ignatzschineria rhizosphaerae TaxID=2923279 RepID=A0ABY3X304_9GAMM|nr:L,D-transpeptidase family protein [Ignatzschineria rhizosphaerae]UNM96280.1 L,D-transpeptidase family protein [Ignatzschineria rhizosphaerae]
MKLWGLKLGAVSLFCFLLMACAPQQPTKLSPSYISGGPLTERLKNYGLEKGDEVLIRIFKEESMLELWMKPAGKEQYIHFSNYPICNFSGTLGPKVYEGDRQAPEGFYRVNKHALNPYSRFYKSFNLGYPNRFDRSLGRTGNYLMVHGKCDSVGCYAMTDEQIEEIYSLVEMALKNGQEYVEVQAYPFRMDAARLEQEKGSKHYAFWGNLQEGYEQFEKAQSPLNYGVQKGRYLFNK